MPETFHDTILEAAVGQCFPVAHDEGANCPPSTDAVRPSRIEADDTSGAHRASQSLCADESAHAGPVTNEALR